MQQDPAAPGSTERTRVRRLPEKAVADRAVLEAVLDEGVVAHVAVVHDGAPFAVPVAYARDGGRVLIHGSTGSRLFRLLAQGAPACLTVTLLDGLVLARSTFESSMHYRSVMVLGTASVLEGDEKLAALDVLSDHLIPGRREHVRPPTAKELAATLVLSLPLDECSAKVSDGWPGDEDDDISHPTWGAVWAGVVPLRTVTGEPRTDPQTPPGTPVPQHVLDLATS